MRKKTTTRPPSPCGRGGRTPKWGTRAAFVAAALFYGFATVSCNKDLNMAGRWDAQLDVTHAVEGTYGNLVYNDKGHATLYFTGSSEGKCMVQAKRSIYLVGTLLEQTDTVDETRIFSYTVDDHTVTMCAEDDTLIGEVDGRGKKMECRWKGNYMHFKRK